VKRRFVIVERGYQGAYELTAWQTFGSIESALDWLNSADLWNPKKKRKIMELKPLSD
jgi:hypothetical protein